MRDPRKRASREHITLTTAMLAVFLVAVPIPAAGGEQAKDAESLKEEALRHIERGEPREAVELLRGKADTPQLSLLLARAYTDAGNDFWAIRTLQELASEAEDCGPKLWLAFTLVRQGSLEEGRDLLKRASCEEGSPLEVRRYLLETLIASTEGELDEARQALREAAGASRAYPEDVEALRALRPSVEEGYLYPLTGRLELHTGWTSNARAGSPMDPAATGGPPASPLANLSGSARMILPTEWRPRPALEAEIRGLGISSEDARSLSYLQLSARPALLFGDRGSILAGYRIDTLGILGGDQFDDGPLFFYQAHRGELEAEVLPWLTVFGGAGHRAFRDIQRSRLEVDLGVGAAFRPTPSLRLLTAVTGRYHNARREFYDLFGATAIIQAEHRLPRGFSARLGLMGSLDDYPTSQDQPDVAGVDRRDIMGRITAGLWSPRTSGGMRGGLTYELSHRSSTASSFEYTDHRLMARGQWSFSLDPRGPSTERPKGHVPLAWGLEEEDGGLEDSIQDLLRQDEAVRAGSACVE